jgi:Zn-dependent protease
LTKLSLIQSIAISIIPLLFAISLHEAAHGYIAYLLGDKTAKLSGRLTLNPIKHIDPIGTVLLPILLMVAGGFIFGWAKPVPIDARNLANPRRDMALVAVIGPLSNLLMAFMWGAAAWLGFYMQNNGYDWLGVPLYLMGIVGIQINIMLMALNLLPIPPLDGSKVLASILPPRMAYHYMMIENYGFIILIALIFTGVLTSILLPIFYYFNNLIITVFGLG